MKIGGPIMGTNKAVAPSGELKRTVISMSCIFMAGAVALGGIGIAKYDDPLSAYYILQGEAPTRCPSVSADAIAAAASRLNRPNIVKNGEEKYGLNATNALEIASKYNYHIYPMGAEMDDILTADTPHQLQKEANDMGALYGFTVHFDDGMGNFAKSKADTAELSNELSTIPVEVVKGANIKEVHLGTTFGEDPDEKLQIAGAFDNHVGFGSIKLAPEHVEHNFSHELQHGVHDMRCEGTHPFYDQQIGTYNDIPYKERTPEDDPRIDFKKYTLRGGRHGMSNAMEDFASNAEFFARSYPNPSICFSNDTPAFQKAAYTIASQNHFGEVTGVGRYGDYLLDTRDAVCGTY